ncbi:MAG: hypothetical protein WAO20_03170 [Acidobacteriota bacterium]
MKSYSNLSDSELISVRAMGKEKADGEAVVRAETELVRRGDRKYEPEVRFRIRGESIAKKRGRN